MQMSFSNPITPFLVRSDARTHHVIDTSCIATSLFLQEQIAKVVELPVPLAIS